MKLLAKLQTRRGSAQPPYIGFLIWFLLVNVILFCGFVGYWEGLWQKVLSTDQSKITVLIVGVFMAASLYLGVHLYRVGGSLERVRLLLDRAVVGSGDAARIDETCEIEGRAFEGRGVEARGVEGSAFVDRFLEELHAAPPGKGATGIDQRHYIFEIYVDRLRGPLEIGSFWSDVLIRLGLIGTIIGFIMMLQSFVSGPSPTGENIQALLITMSQGMGTALYTTFFGLVTSTLLGLQQQLHAGEVERVIAGLIRLSDQRPERARRVPGAASDKEAGEW